MLSLPPCLRSPHGCAPGLRRLVMATAMLGLAEPTWASFGGGSFGEGFATGLWATLLMPPALLLVALLMGALTPEVRWVIPSAIIAATLSAILVCHAVIPRPDLFVFAVYGLIGVGVGLVGGLVVWLRRRAKGARAPQK